MKHKQKFYDEGPWLGGNIRRKLTLFVVLMCFMLVGVFLFVSIFLLQPAYYNIIRAELAANLSTTVSILNTAQRDGLSVESEYLMSDGSVQRNLSTEVAGRLQEAVDSGSIQLDYCCLDIGDTTGNYVFVYDTIAPRCLLHPTHETGITPNTVDYAPQYNAALIRRVRAYVLQNGSFTQTLEGGQMVMGNLTEDGNYTVVMSANLENIPQAVSVLARLMVPVSGILVLIAMMGAWGFSRWFTRPLNRLSAAAKEMAKGNYNVQVEARGNDEIAALSGDFNTMAQEVKRSTQLQKDLIANISHDLRTPLTLIKGYAETVRDLTGAQPEKRTEQLNVIVDETDRLSSLVNSVMELSRMSAGHEKVNPVVFDLSQLADEVAFRYGAACQQSGYVFDFAGDEDCMVEADPALIERVLHNLLGNALNHVGSDGYIGLHLHKQPTGYVRVEVIDHGPGIAEADQPHLFDRYYRSRSDAGRPGTGLGLSITKAIFEAHGFSYGVQSRLGQGATFWFEVPLCKTK